ncbi:MAG: hypothetical protein WDN67_03265 [Candidatus Moraniibacteriota bacterium]
MGNLTSDWSQTGAFDIVLNNASSELRILESAGGAFYGTLDVDDLSANATYTLSGASGTLLTSANYASTLDAAYVNVGESPSSGDITGSFSGGLAVGANAVALGTDTTGNYVAGATASGGLALTGTEAGTLGVLLPSSTEGLSTTTASGSGLELTASGLTLLQGCANTEILAWDEGNDQWECSTVAGVGGLSGSGTNGHVTIWTGANTLGSEAQLALSRGGTGASLSDPGADSILFWDDSAGANTWLSVSSNLVINTTTLDLAPNVQLGANGTDGSLTIFSEQGGTDYTTVFQPGTQTQNVTYTLPNDDGSSGQVLVTNGSGTLAWSSVSGAGGVTGTGTAGYAAYWDSTSSIAAEAQLALSRGGTGASLSDPGADRMLFWDDSNSTVDWLTLAANLAISGTTFDLASSITVNAVQLGANGTDGSLTIFSEQGGTDYTTVFQPGTQTQNVTYTLPNDDGSSNQILTTDGNGLLAWTSAGSSGIGDISAVGDVTSGAAFDGTQGTQLIFNDPDGDGTLSLANLSTARAWTLPNASGTLALLDGGQTFTSATWNGSTITVPYGGTGATTLTSNGVLYGNGTGVIQATTAGTSAQLLLADGSGIPVFATLSGDATLAADGTLTISANAVALTTDTTGNYVASIASGNGISGSSASEGGTPTIAIDLLELS